MIVLILFHWMNVIIVPKSSNAYIVSSSNSGCSVNNIDIYNRPQRHHYQHHRRWGSCSSSSSIRQNEYRAVRIAMSDNNYDNSIDTKVNKDDDANNSMDEEIDLFDYFDPLVSPHAYVNGISSKYTLPRTSNAMSSDANNNRNNNDIHAANDIDDNVDTNNNNNVQKKKLMSLQEIDELRYVVSNRNDETTVVNESMSDNKVDNKDDDTIDSINNDMDLLDYFDPLQSPHSYPNGIIPNHNKRNIQNNESASQRMESKEPFLRQPAKELEIISTIPAAKAAASKDQIRVTDNNNGADGISSDSSWSKSDAINDEDNDNNDSENNQDLDLFEYFDPLLSPHQYPKGIVPSPNNKKKNNIDSTSITTAATDESNNNNDSMNSKRKTFGIRLEESVTTAAATSTTSKTTSTRTTTTATNESNDNNVNDAVSKRKTFGIRLDEYVSSATAAPSMPKTVAEPPKTIATSPTSTSEAAAVKPEPRQPRRISKTKTTTTTTTDFFKVMQQQQQSRQQLKQQQPNPPPQEQPKQTLNVAKDVSTAKNSMGFHFKSTATVLTRESITISREETDTMTPATTSEVMSNDDTTSFHSSSRKSASSPSSSSNTTTNDVDTKPSKVVGILLIDHGSRNQKSNRRLQVLAKLYKKWVNDNNNDDSSDKSTTNKQKLSFVVRGAHMEIAKPSINDGIQSLIRANVDEIICHPYFLSPGRHVTQDIPQIVNEIITQNDNLQKIPIHISDPVGSDTDSMLRSVDRMVQKTSIYYNHPTEI